MLTAAAIGLLCGGALGTRCRVFALVPAHAVAVVVFGAAAWAGDRPMGSVILAMIGWSLGCHGGYLAAALLTPFKPAEGAPPRSVRRAL